MEDLACEHLEVIRGGRSHTDFAFTTGLDETSRIGWLRIHEELLVMLSGHVATHPERMGDGPACANAQDDG
jgi:hypothetical protein